jgi:hypothetical protein
LGFQLDDLAESLAGKLRQYRQIRGLKLVVSFHSPELSSL